MKRIILFLMILILPLFAQQTNHTWGYTTAGAAYTQGGSIDVDSAATTNIVLDLQDYYFMDFFPVAIYDSNVVVLNSTRLFYGTFWLYVEVETATDTTSINVNAYPGFTTYHPNDETRINTTNLTFGSTASAVLNESAYTADDRQWFPINVYMNYTAGKFLPPEFIKLAITFDTASNDSLDIYWDYL